MARKAKDSSPHYLTEFEKALKLVHSGKHSEAERVLAKLVDSYDFFETPAGLLARAKTYLRICEQKSDSGTKKDAEDFELGVFEHNRGNFDKALEHYSKALKRSHDSGVVYRAIAATEARRGNSAAALKNLKKSIELNPINRVHAQNDSDFESIRTGPEFQALIWGE